MSSKSTPHIDPRGEEIAETILLPGDPLRARFIAETYFDNPRCFNEVRGMYGFTGTYRGRKISVMGTGMGIPSISLYSYELIHFFDVKNLIRVGSCGTIQDGIDLYDLIIAQGASTDSSYLTQFGVPGTYAPLSSYRLLEKAKRIADEHGQRTHVGNLAHALKTPPASSMMMGNGPESQGFIHGSTAPSQRPVATSAMQ